MPARVAGADGRSSGCSSSERRLCASAAKRPLVAKARRAVPPSAGRGGVLLHCATCLTPWVSK